MQSGFPAKNVICKCLDRLLTHKAPPIICSRRQFQILLLLKNNKKGMIFYENRLPTDDSHEKSFLFFRKFEKMSQNLSSAAVVIGALRVKFHTDSFLQIMRQSP